MKTKQLFIGIMTATLFCIMSVTAFAQFQWSLDTIISIGGNPSGIAITSDNNKLVITNVTKVYVISTSDYKVDSIDMSSVVTSSWGVEISPDNSTAFVTGSAHIVYINLLNNSVKGSFATPCIATSLYGLAVTPDGSNVIFPDLSAGCTLGGIRIIDASGLSSGSTFDTVSTSGVLFAIAITPDGNSAVVTTWSVGYPKKVNLSTSAVQNIDSISGSYGIAVLHNSNEALIDDGSYIDRVSLIGNPNPKQIAVSPFNSNTQTIAITADDKYAFVVGLYQKLVISLDADSVIQTFTAGATNVATNSDGSWFYVTDGSNGAVRVYKKVSITDIKEIEKGTITVYPNPVTGKITIQSGNNDIKNIEVYNLLGKKVNLILSQKLRNTGEIDLTSQPTGIYLLKFKTKEGIITKKIVKQ